MATAAKNSVRGITNRGGLAGESDLARFVPREVLPLNNPQTDIPRIAKEGDLMRLIEGPSIKFQRGIRSPLAMRATSASSSRRPSIWW